MMSQPSDKPDLPPATERRDFLYYATASTGAVAVGAAVWPLIDSMNPSADVTASGTVRVDLSGLEPGQRITVKWRGRPVFVWRRSPAAIAALSNVSFILLGALLRATVVRSRRPTPAVGPC